MLIEISKYSTFVGALLLTVVFISYKVPLIRYFFEEEAPIIELGEVPPGLGNKQQIVNFKVIDFKSGIELIRARADQGRISIDLFSKNLPLNTKEFNGAIKLNALDLGFKKGIVKIVIEAFDRSLESNGSRSSFELPVRFDAPSIEVLSNQHNAEVNGMELVVYKLKGDNILESGVLVGDKKYIGFPAYLFDGDLSAVNNLYVSMYAISKDFDSEKEKIKVFAVNKVGNTNTESFYYKVKQKKGREWEYKVQDISTTRFSSESILEKELSNIEFFNTKLWKDNIPKPFGHDASPRVGDKILVRDEIGKVVRLENDLIPFRSSIKSPVLTTAPGVISFIKDIKGYEKIIGIDHGFGLVSLYSGLSTISVTLGQDIETNQSLGSPGFISQLGEVGFEYSLFFQGTPVRAEEWWDKTWVRGHILDKIKEIKQRFSITSSMSDNDLKGSLENEKKIERPVIRDLSDLKTNSNTLGSKQNLDEEIYDTEKLKNPEF